MWRVAMACLALAACTPVPVSEASRAAECRAAFQSYDRAVVFDPPANFLRMPPPLVLDPSDDASFARSRIQQLGCVTFPREVPDPGSVDLGGLQAAGGLPAPRQYLHVGILSSNATEAELRRLFEGLGYPVRVKGAELLGRRFFLGPLETETSQANALEAARRLGFLSAYFLGRVP